MNDGIHRGYSIQGFRRTQELLQAGGSLRAKVQECGVNFPESFSCKAFRSPQPSLFLGLWICLLASFFCRSSLGFVAPMFFLFHGFSGSKGQKVSLSFSLSLSIYIFFFALFFFFGRGGNENAAEGGCGLGGCAASPKVCCDVCLSRPLSGVIGGGKKPPKLSKPSNTRFLKIKEKKHKILEFSEGVSKH